MNKRFQGFKNVSITLTGVAHSSVFFFFSPGILIYGREVSIRHQILLHGEIMMNEPVETKLVDWVLIRAYSYALLLIIHISISLEAARNKEYIPGTQSSDQQLHHLQTLCCHAWYLPVSTLHDQCQYHCKLSQVLPYQHDPCLECCNVHHACI